MLWHVADTNLHLMGSMHALKQDRHGLFPEAEQIYQMAQRVVFESDLGKPVDRALSENVAGKPLSTQIPAAVFAHVVREWSNLGLPPAQLELTQPWAVAMNIVGMGAAKRGINKAYGVDGVLWGRSARDGKTRLTLEKPEDALAGFIIAPDDEKASFLDYAVNPPSTFQNDVDSMIQAWHEHDEGAFELILNHRLRMWPIGFELLVTTRNRAWMPKILELAADNIPTLVVVGALHCVGDAGLPKLLEQQGLQASRVV